MILKWLPPVGAIHGDPATICDICKPDGSASQFASSATASHKYNPVYIWQPQQATGILFSNMMVQIVVYMT